MPAQSNEIGCCRRCSGRVFEAEKMTAKCGWFHKSCFKCFNCNKIMDATNYHDGHNDEGIFCKTCHRSIFEQMIRQNTEFAKSVTTSTATIISNSSESSCPRCKGMVFDAEKMAMRSGSYHKKCFTCSTCKRNLDYVSAGSGWTKCQRCLLPFMLRQELWTHRNQIQHGQ